MLFDWGGWHCSQKILLPLDSVGYRSERTVPSIAALHSCLRYISEEGGEKDGRRKVGIGKKRIAEGKKERVFGVQVRFEDSALALHISLRQHGLKIYSSGRRLIFDKVGIR